MTAEPIILDIRNGVALITLNRPEAGNACNAALAHRLIDIWQQLAQDPEVHVVVLTGAGQRHFCTGADLQGAAASGNAGFDHWPDIPEDFFKPVICAVNGVVAGGGWHFLWQADFAIASPNATFLEPHVSVGWVPLREMWGMAVKAPQGAIRRMAYMGVSERMDADRAYQLGILTEIVPQEDLVAHSVQVAETIAKQAPLAVRLQKEAFQRVFDLRLSHPDLYEDLHAKRIQVDWESEDGKEGPAAFAQKRQPVWKGR